MAKQKNIPIIFDSYIRTISAISSSIAFLYYFIVTKKKLLISEMLAPS